MGKIFTKKLGIVITHLNSLSALPKNSAGRFFKYINYSMKEKYLKN